MFKQTILCVFILLASSTLPAQTLPQSLDLQPRSGGTLYVDALFDNDTEVELLLDTGASMLTVNKKTFQQISQHAELSYSHDLGFRTANGKIHRVKVYMLPSLTLGDACRLENVEVAVMGTGHNILGMNVLSKFSPIGLSVQPPRLELSNCDGALITSHNAAKF